MLNWNLLWSCSTNIVINAICKQSERNCMFFFAVCRKTSTTENSVQDLLWRFSSTFVIKQNFISKKGNYLNVFLRLRFRVSHHLRQKFFIRLNLQSQEKFAPNFHMESEGKKSTLKHSESKVFPMF